VFLSKMVSSIVLGIAGDKMMNRAKLLFVLTSAMCLIFGIYLGSNLKGWMYFNDDDDIKDSIYNYAIERIVATGPVRDRQTIRENLRATHPDFFRSKEHECVRFMPEYGQYGFVTVFCKNRAEGTVKISNY
jgi:hypothetical protein